MLYFPTSHNYCFCTTWQNRKHLNCIFSLKHCMLLCQQTQNIENIWGHHLVILNHDHSQNSQLYARDSTAFDSYHLSLTCLTLSVSVTVSNMSVALWQALSEKHWTVLLERMLQIAIFCHSARQHYAHKLTTQSSCCSAKLPAPLAMTSTAKN